MTDPISDLASASADQAERDMPRPVGSPIMDDEDAAEHQISLAAALECLLAAQRGLSVAAKAATEQVRETRLTAESLCQIADGALATAKAERDRAARLRLAIADALLFLGKYQYNSAKAALDNIMDETIPTT